MTWAEVAERLAAARTYWLGSTTVSGAPHAAPVWGVVTGETLYLYSERSTVKARNLAADPRVVIHLESGEDVLIVRGVAEDLGAPGAVPSVVAALAAKYTRPEDQQYLPDHDPTSTSCTRSGRSRRWRGASMTTQPRSAAGRRTYGEGTSPRTDGSRHGQRRVARRAAAAQGRLPGEPGEGGRHIARARAARRRHLVFGGNRPGAGHRWAAPGERRRRLAAVFG